MTPVAAISLGDRSGHVGPVRQPKAITDPPRVPLHGTRLRRHRSSYQLGELSDAVDCHPGLSIQGLELQLFSQRLANFVVVVQETVDVRHGQLNFVQDPIGGQCIEDAPPARFVYAQIALLRQVVQQKVGHPQGDANLLGQFPLAYFGLVVYLREKIKLPIGITADGI